jgi:hypothetical protein
MTEGDKFTDKSVETDLEVVANIFNQLVLHCETTAKDTGIAPQIIVTDHADNLTLKNNLITFEEIVIKRWRGKGFINPIPNINI